MIILTATKNNLVARPTELITSGSVNVYPVQFRFSLDWDGLVRTAIFRAGGTAISVLLDDTNECTIPWEVLVKPGQRLEAGVYGTRDGAVVLPTIWAGLGQIREGAEPGENAQPPTPDILDQALEKAVGYVGQAQSFADQAKSDADRAAQIAADMAVIAKQVSLDAATASKAKEDAQTAQTAAKTAQQAAETAKQAAEDAAKTTEGNATAAATAAQRAEDAANAASAALSELQTLYQTMQTYAAQAVQAIQAEGKSQLEQIVAESTQAQLDIANEKTDALIAIGDATDKSLQAVQFEGETQTANAKAQADRAETEAGNAEASATAAEQAKQGAETAQQGAEDAAQNAVAVHNADPDAHEELFASALDAAVCAALDGTNTTSVFMAWAPRARQTCADDWELLSRWAAILRKWCADTTFTLRSYDASVSGDSTMTPMDDLAKMTAAAQLCTEATEPVTDWADEHPVGGWYIRANARIGADGEPIISAIEGLDATFDASGDLAPVQVFSLALWKREWGDGEYNYKSWRANRAADYAPYPGDVAVDGTKRPMTWHPAYPGGLDSSGALTSGSGLPPLLYTSASNGLTLARSGGAYEGLWSDCDTIWALDMWQLRHWNLENSGIAEGCTSYSLQYTVAMAESGVKRVLITTAQAANLLVGSCVIVGDQGENTSSDRSYAYMRGIADRVRITSIESVEIDGTVYAAVNLDVADAFDTTETTVISTMPWYSGATDKLPGHKDGAYYSLTVAKAPIRVMGVELMHGAYDISLDPLYRVTANADGTTWDYAIYECRDSEKLSGSVTANHTDTDIRGVGIASGWAYVKAFIRTKLGVLFPYLLGGSSSTYYKSAFYGTSSAGVRCPWRFANLSAGGIAGLACEIGHYPPTTSNWYGRPRLSGSGAKRGEWPA